MASKKFSKNMASLNDRLLDAVKRGDTQYVEDLKKKGANMNFKDKLYERTLLHWASVYGQTDTVSRLIDLGAAVDVKDKFGVTPLHWASANGRTDTVSRLVSLGAVVNVKDGKEWTALHLASARGQTDTVSRLVSMGAEVNAMTRCKSTPLHLASATGQTDTVSRLISLGAVVDVKDIDKSTPLHLASARGQTETVSRLISLGAVVNVKGRDESTPLHLASAKGQRDTVSRLISLGASVDVKDRDGKTPYDYALKNDIKGLLKIVKDNIKAGLPRELTQLGKQSASVFTDLLKEETYELFELRLMLQGEQGTGKSTIARFLVGKGPTKFQRSTDGIDLYIGLSFFDGDTEEWIGGKQVFKMEHITLSRSVRSFQQERTPVKQSEQENMLVLKGISPPLPNEITKQIFARQNPLNMSSKETNKGDLEKQGLTHQLERNVNMEMVETGDIQSMLPNDIKQSQREETIELFETEKLQQMLPTDIHGKISEMHSLSLTECPLKKLEVEASLVSEEMYESAKVKSKLSEDKKKEIFKMKVDIHLPEEETMLKKRELLHHSIDEELAIRIEIAQPKEADIVKQGLKNQSIDKELAIRIEIAQPKEADIVKQGLKNQSIDKELAIRIEIAQPKEAAIVKQGLNNQSIDKELASNIDKGDDKEISRKPDDHTNVEIIKNKGTIGKLKAFFGVKKEVKEVKIYVTKETFYNKSIDVAKKNFHRRKLVPVTIWDFGGHDVFYSTHQTFLTYRAVYMLILDGSRTLNDPCKYEQFLHGKTGVKTQKDYVRFWINTIINYCKGDYPGFPKIMVILTHKDKLNVTEIDERRNEIFGEIERMFARSPIEQHLVIKDKIFVNAQNSEDPEMEQIKKSLIHQARNQPTWGQKLPKCFLPLELEIQYLVKRGVHLIHIEHMKKINSQQPVRPLSESELYVFLKFQHSIGKILYFDEPFLDKHIIISPRYLIDAFKSIITDHQLCKGDKMKKEALHSMEQVGIILKQTAEAIWKQKKYEHFFKYIGYLLGVMTHLGILVEPLRYDLAHTRKPTEFYYVASMIRKLDTTGYLQSPTFSHRNIALCFDTISSIIPPALSFRFISYCLSIWGVKTYGDDNKEMLFHRSAVFTIDPSLDMHIQCEETGL